MLRLLSARLRLQTSPPLRKSFLEQVKDLRYRTDAPITDCSAALKETNGDIAAAVEILHKKGAVRAVKKGDRVTQYGFVVACVSPSHGAAVLSMCTETDFAARNAYFLNTSAKGKEVLVDLILKTKGEVLSDPVAATEELRNLMKDDLTATIAALGENVTVHSVQPLKLDLSGAPEGSIVSIGSYTHGTHGVADVGRFVGLAGVYNVSAENTEPLSCEETNSLARHFVANFGDDSAFQHQSFLGTEETVSKWLKRHGVKLAGSMVLEFGKEPIFRTPPKVPTRDDMEAKKAA